MNTTRVLALLPLFVVLAHSFSWDIVVGAGKRLKFYKNGTLVHTEDNPSSKEIYSVAYDAVHFRVLFAEDYENIISILSFDLTTRKIQTLVTRVTAHSTYTNFAYDPLTDLLFWSEDKKICSLSLKPASSNKAVNGILNIVTTEYYFRAIAVDSCGGYIYWVTNQNIERAAFDGSEREVLIDNQVMARPSLAIDQQTQTMYWIEIRRVRQNNNPLYIEYAELNGKNRRTLYSKNTKSGSASSLVVSNDFIYWKTYDEVAILQLPKNKQLDVEPIIYTTSSIHSWSLQLTAANYTIMEQTRGTKVCEALKSLIPKPPASNTSDVGLLNVHMTKASDECYSATCQHYCFQGNCSISAEGHPECSCEAGYSGERCEVNVCYKHCLHGGVCSLNEEDEPVCQCTAEYEGERCDVAKACIQETVHFQEIMTSSNSSWILRLHNY